MNKKKFVKKTPKKEIPQEKVLYKKPRLKVAVFHHISRLFIPEALLIPFILVNLLLIGACLIMLDRISHEQFLEEIEIGNKTVTVPELSSSLPLSINARSYIVYDPTSRVVVDGKNEFLQFAPASATKMMTALVVLDHYKPEDVVIARNVFQVKGSKMNLIEGEAMVVKDLLYGLMLPSGNDAAFVLAQNYPGGQDEFIKAMNEKAKALHLYNTKFMDPSGLRDDNYTTAYDLSRIGSAVLKHPLLSEIVKTQFITVYNTAFTSSYNLQNLNELLYDPQVVGVKTGYTDEASGVLVTGYNYNGRIYIVVVLKSADRFTDTQQIIYGIIPQVKLVTYGR